jgi:hypothetical protein
MGEVRLRDAGPNANWPVCAPGLDMSLERADFMLNCG